jgi:hypothetical protein
MSALRFSLVIPWQAVKICLQDLHAHPAPRDTQVHESRESVSNMQRETDRYVVILMNVKKIMEDVYTTLSVLMNQEVSVVGIVILDISGIRLPAVNLAVAYVLMATLHVTVMVNV